MGGHFCGARNGLTAAERAAGFRRWLRGQPSIVSGIRADCPSFDFACTCPPDDACLADVLAEVAAGGEP